jgi:hypothetical protein
MRVDATCTLALVEHRADDVARHAVLALGGGELGDLRVDLGADARLEHVEPLAKEIPLRANEPRDLGEAMATRVAAATAWPPRMLLRRRVRAPVDVVVESEELLSHDAGFIRRVRQSGGAHEPCTRMRA